MSSDEESGGKKDNPWGTLLGGLFLVAVGIGLYFVFDNFEREGGRMRMNAIVLLIYNTLGKYGVLGVISGLGALMTAMGLRDLMRR